MTSQPSLSESALHRIKHAISWISLMEPAAIPTVFSQWLLIEAPERPTLGTNGRSLQYNPEFVSILSAAMLRSIIMHEAAHVLSCHHHRRGHRDVKGWNYACDLAVNSAMFKGYQKAYDGNDTRLYAELISKESKVAGLFPGHGVFAMYPNFKTAEEYYRLLMKSMEDPAFVAAFAEQLKGKMGNEGMPGEEADDELDGDGSSGDEDDDGGPAGNELGLEKLGADDKPFAGGGRFDMLPDPMGLMGGVMDDAPPEDSERAEESRITLESIVGGDAFSLGGLGIGAIISGYQSKEMMTLEEAANVNWKNELARFLRKCHTARFTFAKPSRRHGYRTDVLMPARQGKNKTKGLFITDTSGSMSDSACRRSLDHLGEILKIYPESTVTMWHIDTALRGSREYKAKDFPLTDFDGWKGRGGSDLKPAFKAAAEARSQYDWIVCVTDMEWVWWDVPNPKLPMLWLNTHPRGRVYGLDVRDLPFGKLLNIHPDAESKDGQP